MQYIFGSLLFVVSLFLVLLVLIQRGRGGGLAGAFGGMGGQSAFGTKAGDLFTRVTMGVAALWILLSIGAIAVLNSTHSAFGTSGASSVFGSPAKQGEAEKSPKGDGTTPSSPAEKAQPSDGGVTGGDSSSGDARPATPAGGGETPAEKSAAK